MRYGSRLTAGVDRLVSIYDDLYGVMLANLNVSDTDQVAAFSKAHRGFMADLEKAMLPGETRLPTEYYAGAQSKEFMRAIIPTIQTYMSKHPRATKFDVLDVGAGTCHGSNLLASMYQSSQLGYRMRVSALDITDKHAAYASVFAPAVRHIVADIYGLNRTYDIIVCSHVIEHVPNPEQFVDRLLEMSRGIVVVCAPFEENAEAMTAGHINRFGQDFLKRYADRGECTLTHSAGWGQFMAPPYEMFILTVRGSAKP